MTDITAGNSHGPNICDMPCALCYQRLKAEREAGQKERADLCRRLVSAEDIIERLIGLFPDLKQELGSESVNALPLALRGRIDLLQSHAVKWYAEAKEKK